MSDLEDLLADLEDERGSEEGDAHSEMDVDEGAAALEDDEQNANDRTSDDLTRLLHGTEMQDVLRQVEEYSAKEARRIMGTIEADPEYALIVRANNISMEIGEEVKRVVEYIKQIYSFKFPDLAKLVTHPLQYAKTVKLIGNEEDMMHLKLNEIVTTSLAMTIVVTATTTNGRQLTASELAQVVRACDVAIDLDAAQTRIIKYVQSRVELIAPNVTKIVGPLTAAKLIGQAGGLTGLAKCPSCNVPSLGKKQGILNGFSTLGNQAHGYLYYCDLVQSVAEEDRSSAQRQVAGKVVLAARIDSVHGSPSGQKGLQFKDELLAKMDKLSEPPELKDSKALPAPNDPARSRRGGKKVRKAKARYQNTELQKQRNRMAFGEEEREVGFGDETEGMGMIGSSSSLLAPQIDSRTRARLSKPKMKGGQLTGAAALLSNRPDMSRRLPGIDSAAGVNGMQSSLNFSSAQGIELPSLNLDALKKKTLGKWFEGGTFSQIKRP